MSCIFTSYETKLLFILTEFRCCFHQNIVIQEKSLYVLFILEFRAKTKRFASVTYPLTTFPLDPTWSQNFSSMCWNIKGWLHSLRSWTIVFMRALAPPLPLLPFSEPSVSRTPLDCICLTK